MESNHAASKSEPLMNDEIIDWAEYSRINQGELDTSLMLLQKTSGLFALVSIKNVSTRTINLFTFNMVSRFRIYLDNKEFQYNGPLASIAPSKRWYSEVLAGETYSQSIDLNEFYDLPETIKGRLRVEFNNPGGGDANIGAVAEQDF